MTMTLLFHEEFDEISGYVFGVCRDAAVAAVRDYDRTQRLEFAEGPVQLFLKYSTDLTGSNALLVVARFRGDTLEIFNALPLFASLCRDFRQASPYDLYRALSDRFGLWTLHKDFEGFRYNPLMIALSSEYLEWLRDRGRNAVVDAHRAAIERFALEHTIPAIKDSAFRETVFLVVHDFCFYGRQHPKALASLGEEDIRDLFLVLAKCIFSYASGESYRYRGKTDFEIVNPASRYESVVGEFKKWRGKRSVCDAFAQAVRLHSTGQECELYLVMLSTNEQIHRVRRTITNALLGEAETVGRVVSATVPAGSREQILRSTIRRRGALVPLSTAIMDLYAGASSSV